jgi:DNA-directed RNA polymerase subunit alpha
MSVTHMQMPQKLELEEASYTNNYGKFIAQPLEKGYGITIGNTLRRVLLSSLPGTAITGIKIEGVLHEFGTIEGVKEDVPDIILNLKGVRMRSLSKKPAKVDLVIKGPHVFTAKDIVSTEGDFEVLNPDHHIATLNKSVVLKMEVRIGRGRGYVASEDNKSQQEIPVGFIPIDSIFTPIKNVKYLIENTRVGQKTDYEKLVLEVETDGSVTPDEAVSSAGKIINDHMKLFTNFSPGAEDEEEEQAKNTVDAEYEAMRKLLKTRVDDLELSVRSHNCLRSANIKTLGELVRMKEDDLLSFKNFGKKSLTEIRDIITERNLRFGMDVAKYKIDED